MIEINLVPEELRKKERAPALGAAFSGITALSQARLLVIVAAALVMVQAILFAVQFSQRSHLSHLQRKAEEAGRRRSEVDKVKESLETLSGRVPSIDQAISGRINWTRTLNALSDAMTPGIWLTGLSYDERAAEVQAAAVRSPAASRGKGEPGQAARMSQAFLTLTGRATSTSGDITASIGKFIKSLKDEKGFSSAFANIAVEDIKGEKFEGQEVMYFKIVCSSRK